MKEVLQHLCALGIAACRVVVGMLVISAGYELIQKEGGFAFWSTESSFTGIFVIVLGGAFVVQGIFPKLFEGSD